MQPGELRQGNIVRRIDRSSKIHLPCGPFLRVWSVIAFNVKILEYTLHPAQHKWNDCDVVDLSAVPLNDEWFQKKFGFDYRNENGEKYFAVVLPDASDELHISCENSDGYWFLTPNEHIQFGVELRYVHQLQNFWFALTGTELECAQ